MSGYQTKSYHYNTYSFAEPRKPMTSEEAFYVVSRLEVGDVLFDSVNHIRYTITSFHYGAAKLEEIDGYPYTHTVPLHLIQKEVESGRVVLMDKHKKRTLEEVLDDL